MRSPALDLSGVQRLAAPCCGRPHDLLVWLDHVRDVAPNGPWAALRCPGCGAAACLELAGEQVAIGVLHEQHGRPLEDQRADAHSLAAGVGSERVGGSGGQRFGGAGLSRDAVFALAQDFRRRPLTCSETKVAYWPSPASTLALARSGYGK